MRWSSFSTTVRRPALLLLAALAVLAFSVSGGAAAAHTGATPGLGAIPPDGNIQSRCQGLHVSSHVVYPGQKVVATTSAGICGSAPKDISWKWDTPQGAAVHGCQDNSSHCTFVAGGPSIGYGVVCILGGSIQGGWESCDYLGVLNKDEAAIDGYLTDKDGGPVAGATVSAYGHPGATTTSGADGYYEMQVKAGTYSVAPSGGSVKGAHYQPASKSATVTNGSIGTASFTLLTGMELQLKFAKTSVPADGMQVVKGTITTTEGGKPLPNVGVRLEAMPGESPLDSVLKGPRASICNGTTRVWPTGTLASPDGYPVTVNTDATGHLNIAITVGTTPGVWRLDAWGQNADGTLSTDPAAASDTQSITFKPLAGTPAQLKDFERHFNGAAKPKTSALSQISASSNTMVDTLAQVTAKDPSGAGLSGLAYALVNGKDGQSVLVFPATKPPVVDSQSEVAQLAPNRDDLVLDPAEWTGAGIPSTVSNATSLQAVMDAGFLPNLPTLAQFDSGASVVAWKGVPGNIVTTFQPTFQYLGWGYPDIAQPGGCY